MTIPIGTVFDAKTHFKKGDIVYGRATTRADLTGPIRVGKVVQFEEAVMCDDMNNCFVGTGADDGDDKYKEYGVLNKAIAHQSHMKAADVLKNFLLTSQYKQGLFDISKTPSAADQMLRIKRSCKGGIMLTASGGGTIHFYIKDIDMAQVMAKNIKGQNQAPLDPITSKELRFVYRHWNDPSMRLSDHVTFWNKVQGKIVVVPAPWDEDPDAWTQGYPRTGKTDYAKTPSTV